ncbi:MAG TPA: EF-hand domain-containing protein [Caulobacteraceae bacterium]
MAMALLAVFAGFQVAAQPAVAPAVMKGPSLFISPSGQPFRAAAGQPYPVAVWFARADKNGDGRVDRAEFRADAEAFFRILDANHDGVIDPFEMQAYENQVVPEILGAFRVPEGGLGSVGEPPGLSSGHRGARRGLFGLGPRPPDDPDAVSVASGAAPFELIPDPEPLAAADLALDGHITLAEFMTVTDRRFDRLDKKGLGYLTLADLPKTLAQTTGDAAHRR